MFFQNNGVSIKDAQIILEDYKDFLDEFVESIHKNSKIEYLRKQIMIAEAVRAASCKKTDFMSWMKSKERSIWKFSKTDEQKEAEAMKAWDKLIAGQNSFLSNNKKEETKPTKESLENRFKRKKQEFIDKMFKRKK
jgi:hypothetical protein